VLAEFLVIVSPPAGMACHLLLVFSLMLQASLGSDRERPLVLALVLAPLTRILSLSFPLAPSAVAYRYALTSVPLFLAALMVARNLGLSRHDLGLSLGRPALQLLIAFVSVPLAVIAYLVLRPAALLKPVGWPTALAIALVLVVCTGFVEEFIFRGVLQTAARSVLGRWQLPYVSTLSASLYLGYRSVGMVALMLAVSLGFGWLVAKSGSILGVSAAHGLGNVGLLLVLPLLGVRLSDW
jgi:membrane protease YdiL (CAAX protease family)